MVKVTWSQAALGDLEAIVRFIALDSETYARRTGVEIFARTRQLARFPLSGRIVPELHDNPQYRELIWGPYRIIYKIAGDSCSIVAVMHSSRDLLQRFPKDIDET